MRAFLLCLLHFWFALSTRAALLQAADSKFALPNQFIVSFRQNASAEEAFGYVSRLKQKFIHQGTQDSVLQTYDIGGFKGFAAILQQKSLQDELQNPLVDYVEADQWAFASEDTVTQPSATWGLDRIHQRELPLDGKFVYPTKAGSRVDAYVIDTGVYVEHSEFEGRASWGFVSVGERKVDCNGHGTHVAGTIGGKIYGVAKDCKIIAVKVLGCGGSGTYSDVISGVEYVTQAHKKSKNKSVANMSLGGGFSQALNTAVSESVKAGVVYVVAAGNEDADACSISPASEKSAIRVGATDKTDTRASFSNWGNCVDIFAPGVRITSSWINGTNSTNTISGTSMASPHVAGIVALHLAENPGGNAHEDKSFIIKKGTPNVVKDPKHTANIFAYSLGDI